MAGFGALTGGWVWAPLDKSLHGSGVVVFVGGDGDKDLVLVVKNGTSRFNQSVRQPLCSSRRPRKQRWDSGGSRIAKWAGDGTRSTLFITYWRAMIATLLGAVAGGFYAGALWYSPFAQRTILAPTWNALYGYKVSPTVSFIVYCGLLYHLPPVALGIVVYVALGRIGRARSRELHCPDCGYILHGLSEPRCPECGRAI